MDVTKVFAHYDDDHPLQGQQRHHCTDRFWFVLLCLGVAGLVPAELYAFRTGDFGKFTHLWDYRSAMCGRGFGPEGTEDVLTKPYLYICLAVSKSGNVSKHRNVWELFDIMHPICVESCPQVAGGALMGPPVQYCPTEAGDPALLNLPPKGAKGELFPQYSMNSAPLPFDGLFLCRSQMIQDSMGQTLKAKLARFYSWWQSLTHGLVLLLPSSLLALLVAVSYVLLLDTCAALLGRLCAVIMVVVPLLLGVVLLVQAARTAGDGAIAGTVCVLLGLVSALMVYYMRPNFDIAVGCIEAACECIHDEPSLFLAPTFAVVARFVTFWAIFPAIYFMSGTGSVSPKRLDAYEDLFALLQAYSDLDLKHITISIFKYSALQKAIVAYLGFMKVWLLETTHGMSQYALAYATQLWYFAPYEAGGKRKTRLASCGILHGYASVLRYHMGSVSLAALLLTYLSMAKRVIGALACGADGGNPCMHCMAHCCCLCRFLFFQFLQFLNTAAFMDIAISSDNFLTAAPRATALMLEEGGAVVALQGTQFLFLALGMLLTCTLPAILTYFLSTTVGTFSSPEGAYYIPHPVVPTALCVLPSLLIGSSFMLLLDTVADTVLYCFAVDEKYQSSRATRTPTFQVKTFQQQEEEEEEGEETFWQWLLGTEDEVQREVQAAVTAPLTEHYAPRRLQQLIEDHKRLAEMSRDS